MKANSNYNNQDERFSVFPKGWRNQKGVAVLATSPQQEQTISWVGEYIRSERARWATLALRDMREATKEEVADFKKLNFETATFSGTFSYRSARGLTARSPFMVLDIDDLADTDEARRVQQLLVGDPAVETALCFVSPKGRGAKWVVRLPLWAQQADHRMAFHMLERHVAFEFGIAVDRSGSDICRTCFLPYDPECYINPKYTEQK